jgi:hypothetical protein
MTFRQARKKLEKIADGRYHGLMFEATFPAHSTIETKCRVYITIDTKCWMEDGRTWDEAFARLDCALKGIEYPGSKPERLPDSVKDTEFASA